MGDADARAQSAASPVRDGADAGQPVAGVAGGETGGATEGETGRLLVRAFNRADISGLRHAVAHYSAESGLSGPPLDDFVLAVNELVTNAVRHGGGAGVLRLWRTGRELLCEVTDHGAGIADRSHTGRERPAPSGVGGWGLWLARRLSDTMAVDTGTDGTAIRISAVLPEGPMPTAPSD